MHTLKHILCLMLSLLVLLTSSSTLHANATSNDDSQYLTISKTEAREIYEDSMTMQAEIQALNDSLTSERAATKQLIFSINESKKTTDELIATYKDLNEQQNKQINTLKRDNRQTKTLFTVVTILLVAGCVAAAQ